MNLDQRDRDRDRERKRERERERERIKYNTMRRIYKEMEVLG